jgi:hypothetical protein
MDFESLNDALIECVKAAGGSKAVASILWPEKPLSDAQRLLLACLNTERSEKLCPNQTMLILKLAKEVGVHSGISFICNYLGYSTPTPIEPEDEKAKLMRDFIAAQKAMSLIAIRLENVGLRAVA